MTTLTDGYLAAATAAAGLLSEPAVARQWAAPSALPRMSVGALAVHLARQVFSVEAMLDGDGSGREPIPLLDHYARVAWIGAGLDDEPNVGIRDDSAAEAAQGPAVLAVRACDTVGRLTTALASQPLDRVVALPWASWALTLEDLLITRLMEITVHCDDLAHSTGLPAPALPGDVTDAVVVLLARLAVRRHGPTAVVRALSRAERAPETIAAF